MSNANAIKAMLSAKVNMTPAGFVADELGPEQFADVYELFFDEIFEISSSDIAGVRGYGEFNDECKTEYETCREYLIGTFAEDKEGYWYNWTEMFDTTAYPTIIAMKGNADYKRFMKFYGNIFFYVHEA